MRALSLAVVLFHICSFSGAQTRVFVFGGGSLLTTYEQHEHFYPKFGNSIYHTDGDYATKKFRHLAFDIEIEHRVQKLFLVTGVRFFQSGYKNSYETNFSKLTCSHIGIPLNIRLNINNFLMLDLGPMLVYTPTASLNETALKGSSFQVNANDNIAHYLPPRLGLNLQYSLVFNRYCLTAYFYLFNAQVTEAFATDWPLGGRLHNNSLFLRDFYPHFQVSEIGLKAGVRIL